jgi:hypothetical protein
MKVQWISPPDTIPLQLVQGLDTFNLDTTTSYVYSTKGNCPKSTPRPFEGSLTIGTNVCSYNNFGLLVLEVLPVKFISWSAKLDNQTIDVFWSTVQEVNNDHFVILSSQDANNWTEETKIGANLSRSERSDYQVKFGTRSPTPKYIKIQSMDVSGKASSSKIFSIGGLGTSLLSFYPNPIKIGSLTAVCKDCDVKCAAISVFLPEGRLEKKVSGVFDGDQLDMSYLSKGFYIVKI